MKDKGLWLTTLVIVAFGSVMLYGRSLEGYLLPVSVGFSLDKQISINAERNISLSGHFENVRDCEFDSIAFHYMTDNEFIGRGAFIRNDQPKNTSKSRGMGKHTFGPWVISVPEKALDAKSLKILVDHKCHPLWTTRTELVTLPMKPFLE